MMMSYEGVASVNFQDLFPFDKSRKASGTSDEELLEPKDSQALSAEDYDDDESSNSDEEDDSEQSAYSANDLENSEELRKKLASGDNAVISEFGIRGQRGRRLTFIMQEVPDVLVKREKDAFLQGAADLCGSDIFSEQDESDDELWTPKEIGDEMAKVAAAPTEKELDESLSAQLLSANDETDALYKLDSLSGETLGPKNGESPPKRDKSVSFEATYSTPELIRNAERTSTMNMLQLRLWFLRVRQSYRKGVKIIKVNSKGQKHIRNIEVGDDCLVLSRAQGQPPRRCHLSAVKSVKLGFVSDAFHQLLDITPEHQPVPPPQNCVVVALPNQLISIILP